MELKIEPKKDENLDEDGLPKLPSGDGEVDKEVK